MSPVVFMDTTSFPVPGNETFLNCVPYVDTTASYFPWQWTWAFERMGIILANVIGGAISIPILAPLALCIAGFTCYGVLAGSAAACCQSSIGNVQPGSCFSCAQSSGAGGCPQCFVIILVLLAFGGACLDGYLGVVYTCSMT